MSSLFHFQQIFPTQESNQGLLHYRQILYPLSYQGSPTGKIHELNEPMHVKWFAECLALSSGIQYIICHFYNFVKLVGKHVICRTARESWLEIMNYKFYTLYLWKYTSVQISCLEQRDNDFCSLADDLPPTMRIQGSNSRGKDEAKCEVSVWGLHLMGLKWETLKPVQSTAASLLGPEVLFAPQRAQPPTWPVSIKLFHTIKAQGCPLTVWVQCHIRWPGSWPAPTY